MTEFQKLIFKAWNIDARQRSSPVFLPFFLVPWSAKLSKYQFVYTIKLL